MAFDRSELDDRWFSHQPIPGLCFVLNDPVRIVAGEYAGEFGSVMAVLSREPVPIYIVERSLGGDITVSQSDMEPVS
jgi:hypothetical protein